MENFYQIEVELPKHKKTPQGNCGISNSMFYSNFLIVKQGDLCIFPLSNKLFHVCTQAIQVFFDGRIS